jgi:hypothetical protein
VTEGRPHVPIASTAAPLRVLRLLRMCGGVRRRNRAWVS